MVTGEQIEQKYSRLLKDVDDAVKYYRLGGLCLLLTLIFAMSAIGLLYVYDPIVLASLTIAAVASGIISFPLFRKWKRLQAKEKNIPAISVYETYKAVRDFINTDFGEEHRHRAIKNLRALALVISQWRGPYPPLIISSTIDNLSKGISEKCVPIIESGSKEEIESLNTLLFNFLLHLDVGITWESLNEFSKRFNELPSKPQTESAKVTVPIIQNPRFRYPIVAVPSWLGLFFLFYYSSGEQLAFALGVSIAISLGILNFIKKK